MPASFGQRGLASGIGSPTATLALDLLDDAVGEQANHGEDGDEDREGALAASPEVKVEMRRRFLA